MQKKNSLNQLLIQTMPEHLAREIAHTMAEAETIIRRLGGLLDRNPVALDAA